MKLRFWRESLRLVHPWTIARGSDREVVVSLLELSDADGVSGLGEASPISRYNESVESVESFYRKVDCNRLSFDDVSGNMSYLESLAPDNKAAKCALNIALMDGTARRASKPVHDFLGLGFRDNHHVTSFSIGIDRPEVVREKTLAAANFPVLKLKVGVPDDSAVLRALRVVAPAKPVRVDANEGWTTRELALEKIHWLAADGNIQFVEQPMSANASPKDWAWLKVRSPLPIFADESYHSAADAARCADCFHGVNVKLVKAGGISAAFEALSGARDVGLKTMLGCMIETSVLVSAAAHLAELCDFLDLDGNLLISNDPYAGVSAERGLLSFAHSEKKTGLCVAKRC